MFYVSNINGTQNLYSPRSSDGIQPISKVSSSNPIEKIERNATTVIESAIHERTQQQNPYERLDQPPMHRQPALLASQIMSAPVVTLSVNDLVETAWKLFHAKRFRHVPVISEQGKLVGVLSDRDFLSLGLARNGEELSRQEQMQRPIREIMTSNVLTSRPENSIRAVAKVMFEERISALPIVDDKEQLVGILTSSDILRTLVNNAPLELWI